MASPFKIEKNVPLPQRGLYPWKDMEVGDSFFVPCKAGENQDRTQNRMAGIAAVFRRKHPDHRFTVRKTDDGVRVWRVA